MKREIMTKLAIIFAIFVIGLILRVESTHLSIISDNEKPFYQGQDGLPYMYEMDSYYNYRLTGNFLDHGYLGDTVISGRVWDLHSYYPPGVPLDYPPLIVYLSAFIYKLVNLFKSVPLLTVCFWLPAFIGPLAGIPAYFFVSRLTNVYGGLVAGVLAVTAPLYFVRSVPGWFDTDMFIVLFSILVVWFFVEAVQSDNRRMQMLFAGLAAFFMFLFALAWNGWQYLFYLLVLFTGFYLLWGRLKGRDVKNLSYILVTFFMGTLLLVGIFMGFLNLINLFAGPFELTKLFGSQSPWGPWPDLYTTVSELQQPSVEVAISELGLSFFLGIFGLFWMFRILASKELKKRFLSKISWFLYLLLVVWIIVGILALFKGARFIMLLTPPLLISAGIMAGISIEYLNVLKSKKSLIKVLSLVVVLIITVPAIFNAYENYYIIKPLATDDLWNSAQWIHNNTPNGTVIISEWSYGHLFTAIADRPVTLDGRMGYIETLPIRRFDSSFAFGEKSPNVSRDYWINRALSTSNETLSSGIFRMLASSGDYAHLTLDQYTGDTAKNVEILNNILGVDREAAHYILLNSYHLNEKQAETVLKYTHPDRPHPFVLVTSTGMINGGKYTFHSGNWDFKKDTGENYTYSTGKIDINNYSLNTSNGITMDLKTGDAKWNNVTPYCTMIITNDKLEKHYLDKNSDFCLILLMDNRISVVIDKRFENSMFVKLLLERTNSTGFKAIYENKNFVVWEATSY